MTNNKKYISLNKKIIAYSFAVTFITLVSIWGITHILVKKVVELENQLMNQDMERIVNSIDYNISQMSAINIEYSCWDSTVEYILGQYPELIEENFMDETFESNNWNAILLMNLDGEVAYQKGYDLENQEEVWVDPLLLDQIWSANFTKTIKNKDDKLTGILLLKDGSMMITIHPILSSYKDGPVNGYFITGRYMDQMFLDELSNLTKYDIGLSEEQFLIPNEKKIELSNIRKAHIWTTIGRGNWIKGHAIIYSLGGSQALNLSYQKQMGFYAESKNTIYYYVGIIIIIIILNLFGILVFVNKIIIKRLNSVLHNIGMIITNQDISTRVNITSNDELSVLGTRFNKMLDTIEELNQQLYYRAHVDQLTELPNRHYFYDLVHERMKQEAIVFSAILFMDLDKFKEINDSYGHRVGDEFLKKFASTVKEILNPQDIMCRLGGDEFVIWMDSFSNMDEVKRFTETILEFLKDPIEVCDNNLYCLPSIGISIYPRHSTDIDTLINNADSAMYKAKNSQNGYAFYSE
ncbi:MAG: hypothetical protein CVU84_12570 [Firmicutes bacterium HGW-Firmicutes-1]|jgi:diguanylate cyclase (GGDEF)-like protein|nr:MAG: hypothetical protein CVU84_12570 [Firmicutes bacterium HGW-Firmicutes-1]